MTDEEVILTIDETQIVEQKHQFQRSTTILVVRNDEH